MFVLRAQIEHVRVQQLDKVPNDGNVHFKFDDLSKHVRVPRFRTHSLTHRSHRQKDFHE